MVVTRRLATEGLGPAVVVDELLSSGEGTVHRGASLASVKTRHKRELPLATAAATRSKCTPRGHSPGFVARGEPGKGGLAVGGPQAVVNRTIVQLVVLHAARIRDAVGVVRPADNLIPAKAAERCILLLVRVRAELTKGAGDLDEVGCRRYFIHIAVAAEHLRKEGDSGLFAGGGRDIAVVIITCTVGGADCVVIHADVCGDFKNPAGPPRHKSAGGANFGWTPVMVDGK